MSSFLQYLPSYLVDNQWVMFFFFFMFLCPVIDETLQDLLNHCYGLLIFLELFNYLILFFMALEVF